MTEGGDRLGWVQGVKQSGGTVPAQPRSCHPAAQHQRTQGSAPPDTVHLLTTGRGTSKPGHFNIRAAREREGRLEDTGTRSDPLMGTEGVG